MPDGAKILDLMDEIEQLPGYHFYYEDVKGLELSTYIFYANFNDMNRLITLVTTHPKFTHLFYPANKETLYTFGYDIVRRVHNFLASVLTVRSFFQARNEWHSLFAYEKTVFFAH